MSYSTSKGTGTFHSEVRASLLFVEALPGHLRPHLVEVRGGMCIYGESQSFTAGSAARLSGKFIHAALRWKILVDPRGDRLLLSRLSVSAEDVRNLRSDQVDSRLAHWMSIVPARALPFGSEGG